MPLNLNVRNHKKYNSAWMMGFASGSTVFMELDMEHPIFTTASRLAQAIHCGAISSLDVVDAHLAQIARHNPKLNAIVTLDMERARQRAREADAGRAARL